MNTRRYVKAGFTMVAYLLMLLLFSGCGAQPAAMPEAPQEPVDLGMVSDGFAEMEEESDSGSSADQPAADDTAPDLVAALPQDRMIIKNGEIDLLVESADAAIDQVTQIASDNGGYVLSSQASKSGASKIATITIAVKSDQFDTAMRRLRQIAVEVQREISTGEDVSSEYVDLESRLRSLEATRDRIQSFLEDAKTVEEALKVNQQLSDIEAEIEQVKGRMNYLSGRSAFSTITVNIQEKIDAEPTPTPTPKSPWSLSPVISDATKTQVSLAQGLLSLITWLLIVPGPYCLISGLLLWGVMTIVRRRKGSRPPAPPKKES
ncbi:MAG: DUF4349 domain-containing protein [Anaerolineae bacterium]|nr:DUF4349 domain-containing protein [Anaerolineae bacterium]